jgi:hypothetical protein
VNSDFQDEHMNPPKDSHMETWRLSFLKRLTVEVTQGAGRAGVNGTRYGFVTGAAKVSIVMYPKNTYISYFHILCDNPHPKLNPGWSAFRDPMTNEAWTENRNKIVLDLIKHIENMDKLASRMQGVIFHDSQRVR